MNAAVDNDGNFDSDSRANVFLTVDEARESLRSCVEEGRLRIHENPSIVDCLKAFPELAKETFEYRTTWMLPLCMLLCRSNQGTPETFLENIRDVFDLYPEAVSAEMVATDDNGTRLCTKYPIDFAIENSAKDQVLEFIAQKSPHHAPRISTIRKYLWKGTSRSIGTLFLLEELYGELPVEHDNLCQALTSGFSDAAFDYLVQKLEKRYGRDMAISDEIIGAALKSSHCSLDRLKQLVQKKMHNTNNNKGIILNNVGYPFRAFQHLGDEADEVEQFITKLKWVLPFVRIFITNQSKHAQSTTRFLTVLQSKELPLLEKIKVDSSVAISEGPPRDITKDVTSILAQHKNLKEFHFTSERLAFVFDWKSLLVFIKTNTMLQSLHFDIAVERIHDVVPGSSEPLVDVTPIADYIKMYNTTLVNFHLKFTLKRRIQRRGGTPFEIRGKDKIRNLVRLNQFGRGDLQDSKTATPLTMVHSLIAVEEYDNDGKFRFVDEAERFDTGYCLLREYPGLWSVCTFSGNASSKKRKRGM